jgi:hypothetical protein
MSQQPLRLRNPTQYHLMATQQNLPERVPYRDSPSSEQLEFTDPFPQNMLLSSPGMHDFEDEEYNNQNNSNNMYDNRPINSNMVSD